MAIESDKPKGTDLSRRELFASIFPSIANENAEPQNSTVEKGMNRRSVLAIPVRTAITAVLAKLAFLTPKEAEAAYTPEKFKDEIWAELDPVQITSEDFTILDNRDLPRPPLYFKHNVRGKIEKDGRNIDTPSLSFELAKYCWRTCKDRVANIDIREKFLEHMRETAAPGHRDYDRIMEIYNKMIEFNSADRADWEPLVGKARSLITTIENLVMKEHDAAVKTGTASPAEESISAVNQLIPLGPEIDHGDDFDPWDEILPSTQDKFFFRFFCGSFPYYTPKKRQLSNNKFAEGAMMLRDVALLHWESAVQRHKAYENILADAIIEPDKQAKARLEKIAYPSVNKPIRDGWSVILSEERGNEGELIKFVMEMMQALRNQMERAYEINRCAPMGEESEADIDYLDDALKALKESKL